jgi:class 3 adenylate cyclase/tetratricopeptide (TPR) repeat protein
VTVLFCDLVGSTALSEQLDPEELRELVTAYQSVSAAVISSYDGYIAQYLGDGLVVYFGYPMAHEDDAPRAVRAALRISEEVASLGGRLQDDQQVRLAVRIGIHTGLVVVGAMGGGGRQERLAVGETPNVAARLQGMAEPSTVAISAATYRLVSGLFECRELGTHRLKGIASPVTVYQVVEESAVRSRFEPAATAGLTPLVGREQEVGLVLDRWERVKEHSGQVLLVSGEAGIGKSRLIQALKDRLAGEPHTSLECGCSPYYQNSALYPVIDLLQRLLGFSPADAPSEKLGKLERFLERQGFSLADTVPLFASLLPVSSEDWCTPLGWTHEKQREKTLEALLAPEAHDGQREVGLLARLGRVLWLTGRYDESLDLLHRAADEYRKMDDLDAEARVMAQILYIHDYRGTGQAAQALAESFQERLGGAAPSRGLVEFYTEYASTLRNLTRHDEGLGTAQRGVEAARALGDEHALAYAQGRLGMMLVSLGRSEEARVVLEEAIPILEREGDLAQLARAYDNLSGVYENRGDTAANRRYRQLTVGVAEQLGDPARIAWETTILGMITMEAGDWQEARAMEAALATERPGIP